MRAKKYYGQNFINDSFLIKRIVNLLEPQKNANDLVIEIGPGKGALTSVLAQNFKRVVAIEIDPELIELLQAKKTSPNLELIEGDILRLDLAKLVETYREPGQKVAIISNLPYYITSPILFKIYQHARLFDRGVFMLQKEVAHRISATKDDRNYNNLSVISQFFGTISPGFVVPRRFFTPPPQVDSALIKIEFFRHHLFEEEETKIFLSFVRQLFNNRRKTILNNLARIINRKDTAQHLLDQARINPVVRPENLELSDYVRLFNLSKNLLSSSN